MKKDPRLYIVHILESIQRIEGFVGSRDQRTFEADEIAVYATLYPLQTLAESAQRLPMDIQQRHSHIPWEKIRGFRNILVHEYLEGIDPGMVWNVIVHDLTILKVAMESEFPLWKTLRDQMNPTPDNQS